MGSNSWRAGLLAGVLLMAQGAQQAPAGAAEAAVNVPCNTALLISAIKTANGAGSPQTLNLAASCTYNLTGAAAKGTRGDDGLPIITGKITLVGDGTTIRRAGTDRFRLIEVAGSLGVVGLTLREGDAGANTGGGILNARGTVSVNSSLIYANVADNGAGVSNDRGTFTITGSVLRSNTTLTHLGGGGGGIYNDGTMTLNSTNIYFNHANTSGGGIYNELTGRLSVAKSQLDANTAQLRGGGLYNGTNGHATFADSTITHNLANETGGAIYNATCRCAITLTNTKIVVNEPNNCAPSGSVTGCTG